MSKSDHERYDELRRKLRRERGTINKARSSQSIETLGTTKPNKRIREQRGGDDGDEPEMNIA